MSRPEPIPALTGLRIIGAGWVVLFHFKDTLYDASSSLRIFAPILERGGSGVPLFFLLSGYIIWHNYGSPRLLRSPREPVRFLWRRFARLWPVNALSVVLSVPLIYSAVEIHGYWGLPVPDWYSVAGFLGSVFMVQVLTDPLVHYPWNQPAWSLSAEMVAYVIFPIVVAIAIRLRAARLRWICLPLALILASLAYLPGFSFPYRWLIELMVVFVAGVLLRVAGRPTRAPLVVGTLQVLAPVGIIVACYMGNTLAVTPLLAVWVWSLGAPTGPVVAFMKSKPMQIAGLSSYSVYMLHWVIFGYGYLLLERVPVSGHGKDLFVMIALVVVAFASWACWRFFETPAREVLNVAFEKAWPGRGKATVTEQQLEAAAGMGGSAHADASEQALKDRGAL